MYFFWDFVILKIFTFPNSHSTLHQSSKDRGGKQGWSSTRPYHRKSLWVDLFKIQNPYKSQLHFTPSFLFCILSIFDNFQNSHISQTPTLHFLSPPGTMTGSKVDGPQEGTIGLRVKFRPLQNSKSLQIHTEDTSLFLIIKPFWHFSFFKISILPTHYLRREARLMLHWSLLRQLTWGMPPRFHLPYRP